MPLATMTSSYHPGPRSSAISTWHFPTRLGILSMLLHLLDGTVWVKLGWGGGEEGTSPQGLPPIRTPVRVPTPSAQASQGHECLSLHSQLQILSEN